MRHLFGLLVLLVCLFTIDLRAQGFYTDLNGFRLKQYREAPQNELGKPFESKTLDDGYEYDAFMLKPDGALYMVFEYAPGHTDTIWSIQISGSDSSAEFGFRGLHFGMPAAQLEKELGLATTKVDIGEYGSRWQYNKSNFSIEIDSSGKLSSIKIKDISDKVYPTPDLKKIPHLADVVKVLTTGSNSEMAKLIAPDMELYHDGATLYFQRSLKSEIATDQSRIFATIQELAKELKAVNPADPAAYDENMRLTLGENPKHVMKFKKDGKVKEIVFKYEWGEFLIFEFDAGRPPENRFTEYEPRLLKDLALKATADIQKRTDVAYSNEKKNTKIALSANTYPSRVKVIYTGESRKISEDRKAVIVEWLGTMSKPKESADLFQDEYLFNENGVQYWLPVQKPVAEYFPKELKKGDSVTLFVAWLGGRYAEKAFDNVFIVNDFEKDK